MAYALLLGGVAHAAHCVVAAPGHRAARTAVLLAAALVAQATIGIVTLVTAVPLGPALLHQAFAMVVLSIAVVHRCGLRADRRAARAMPVADPAAEIIGLPAFAPGRLS